jgi:hypothetical protein
MGDKDEFVRKAAKTNPNYKKLMGK